MTVIDLSKIKKELVAKQKKTGCLSVAIKLPDGVELIYFRATGNFRAMSPQGIYSDNLNMNKKLVF